MRNDLLTRDDAVNVCLRFLRDYSDVDLEEMRPLVETDMEQKTWINCYGKTKSLEVLNNLTFEINPSEIARQIKNDNLRNWCKTLQVQMKMAMVVLPLK